MMKIGSPNICYKYKALIYTNHILKSKALK